MELQKKGHILHSHETHLDKNWRSKWKQYRIVNFKIRRDMNQSAQLFNDLMNIANTIDDKLLRIRTRGENFVCFRLIAPTNTK